MRTRDLDRLDRKLARLLGWMRTESDTGQPWYVRGEPMAGVWPESVLIEDWYPSRNIAQALTVVEEKGYSLILTHYAGNDSDEYSWTANITGREICGDTPALAVTLALISAVAATKGETA